jgi:exopolysaccharide biosynthesis polyprenyl glycosylphosphotransferase
MAPSSPREVVILGTGPLGRHTGNDILEGNRARRLVGYVRFDDEAPNTRLHAALLGTSGDLERLLRERVVDEVFLATTEPAHGAAVQAAIQTCERFGVPFAVPACAYRIARAVPANRRAVEDGYLHYLETRPKPLQLALKRLVDILVSGIALLLLSPLLALTALAVKATSRGPVLFGQERVGLHGRRFAMLKFRSMIADAESRLAALQSRNEQAGPVFKMKRDPRITPVGRFIRKYSIDELPQLVNVLRGDMALVGPRPPIPGEVARYEAWQRRRLSVRPGLTCTWQVSGRNAIGFEDWMMLDLRYIDHWSLAADLTLLVKTVPVVLTGRGAS